MGFFERNRAELAERGIDPARLPPGQYHTDRFPVLNVEAAPPQYAPDLSDWSLRISGRVRRPVELSWDQLHELPIVDIVTDIHCVTKWSKFDTRWQGVRIRDVLALAQPEPDARHLLETAESGYTTNVPLADVMGDHALVAWGFDGAPLAPEHGGPVRLLVPHLYFWKSAKWLRGLELLAEEELGYWERNGYHAYGDPFREQRFTND